MYNLQGSSSDFDINMVPMSVYEGVNITPKTPEIINSLMAITHPLDNTPVIKKEETNVPKTPEIINSLMAITNPLDSYVSSSLDKELNTSCDKSISDKYKELVNNDDKNITKISGSSLQSPNTVQNICSQLIKEELKVTLQRKRREQILSSSSSSCSNDYTELPVPMLECAITNNRNINRKIENELFVLDTEEEDQEDSMSTLSGTDLTEEDEDKRRKRRERNKIAATKCRLKKKEKTVSLVQESEILENQNYNLKSQIQELEIQRRRLVDMLTVHKPTCIKSLPDKPEKATASATNFYQL